MKSRAQGRGQVLVMFVLFLLVLLGVSALAIDYASWLLTDRNLQNVSDHAALAGSSAFADERFNQANCSSGGGATQCVNALTQAWTSLNTDLGLGLSATVIGCLATNGDSPPEGDADSSRANDEGPCASEAVVTFSDQIWVTTPPPAGSQYKDFGGRYENNFGVVWVRVDRTVRSFLGGALGIQPSARTGWSTAGAIPTDFALQIFCRNFVAPEDGVCANAAALTIDGQGGIWLIRGDIGSNESLKVTAQTGMGVVLQSGNMFLVQGACGPSRWNCAATPAVTGGLADDDPTLLTANNKSAFYMPPQPIPIFESPLDFATTTVAADRCDTSASETDPCVPYMPYGSNQPGDWTCLTTGYTNLCGQPCAYLPASPTCTDPATLSPGDTGYGLIRCDARIGGTPSRHLTPWGDGSGASGFHESPDQGNGEDWMVLDDDPTIPAPDTIASANPPDDYIYQNGTLGTSGGSSTQRVTYNLRPPFGIPQSGDTVVSYTAFKTDGSANLSDTGNVISVSATLKQDGTAVPGGTEAADAHTLSGTPQVFSFTVPSGQITDYTSLSITFTFHTVSGDNSNKRGGGIAWAEAYTPDIDPALPAMIPPGYYHSISIPDGGCAIMDPTGVYFGLQQYQLPGVYRFGSQNDAEINLGTGSYLIGDGVTLVFDPDFPDPTGGRGIVIGPDGAMAINTSRVNGDIPACTPDEPPDTFDYNPSAPLVPLPHSSVCASWSVDTSVTVGLRPGSNAWPVCVDTSISPCVGRDTYNPPTDYRGVAFYFDWTGRPSAPTDILGRFQLQGGSGSQPGIAFRGILYAPYDDVVMSGSNGFNTVGQVLSWSAKFNGGDAYIFLDYPYTPSLARPFLLEPTVGT